LLRNSQQEATSDQLQATSIKQQGTSNMASTATRAAFGEAIATLGEKYPNIIVVDADLAKSTMTLAFAKKFPNRHLDIGIAEGNLVGIGAGLALAGKIPFICSFACFLAGRFEQIRLSVAYTDSNVRLVGTHAGIGIGEDGYSQMALEDIALMRSLPNVDILQPADKIETLQAVEFLVHHDRPTYLRLTRHKLDDVHESSYRFQFGKGDLLRAGNDVILIATGGLVKPSLDAAETLAKEGIKAAVINIHSIRPLDNELIVKWASKTRHVVTLEDHAIRGGLGGAVAELLSEEMPVPVKRLGMSGFGESGTQEALYEKYGFTGIAITATVKKFLKA
jgi:transketolase